MKHYVKALLVTALIAATGTGFAEWEPRGACYLWTGSNPPEEAPENMLKGVFYDYNRNAKGDFYSNSKVYREEEKNGLATRDLKTLMKNRNTGANNPTNSPDLHGHYTTTLKELINGRYGLLKKYYKYPYRVAAPHFYMAPAWVSLSGLLKKTQNKVAGSSSDFITDTPAEPEKRNKIKKPTKATVYDSVASWFGIFRGRVIAPRTMRFRFFGAADDTIAVRFGDKLVLETGLVRPELYRGNGLRDKGCALDYTLTYQKEVAAGRHSSKREYVMQKLKSTPYCNRTFGGLTGGVPITVKEGAVYPIEIIIGNIGGTTLYYLLTQEVTPEGNAPLQLFRTNEATPTKPSYGRCSTENGPLYEADSDIWQIASTTKKKKEPEKKAMERFQKLR